MDTDPAITNTPGTAFTISGTTALTRSEYSFANSGELWVPSFRQNVRTFGSFQISNITSCPSKRFAAATANAANPLRASSVCTPPRGCSYRELELKSVTITVSPSSLQSFIWGSTDEKSYTPFSFSTELQ